MAPLTDGARPLERAMRALLTDRRVAYLFLPLYRDSWYMGRGDDDVSGTAPGHTGTKGATGKGSMALTTEAAARMGSHTHKGADSDARGIE